MIIARNHQHAAMFRGPVGIAMLQRVSGTINAGAFAVPHAKHAGHGAVLVSLDLLAAKHSRCSQIFIDCRQERHLMVADDLGVSLKFLIDSTKR